MTPEYRTAPKFVPFTKARFPGYCPGPGALAAELRVDGRPAFAFLDSLGLTLAVSDGSDAPRGDEAETYYRVDGPELGGDSLALARAVATLPLATTGAALVASGFERFRA